jgi:hypothetical protein
VRKSLLAGVALSLVLVGAFVPLLLPARPLNPRINEANSERVKEGRSQAEVEEVLGGPPGDYRTRPAQVFLDHWAFGRPGRLEVWYGDEGAVLVYFDSTGEVLDPAEFIYPYPETGGGLLATLRWRLNRCWERLWGRGP